MVGNLLVALALFSGELDVQATAVVEARAGEQPAITDNNQEQAFVAAIVTPTGAVVYREPGLSLRLSYSPRIYWAYPNAIENSVAPLLLHTAGLVVAAQTTKRFALQGELSGSFGQPDYSSLSQTFSGAVPQLTITKIASATGGIITRTALTRRWELDARRSPLLLEGAGNDR